MMMSARRVSRQSEQAPPGRGILRSVWVRLGLAALVSLLALTTVASSTSAADSWAGDYRPTWKGDSLQAMQRDSVSRMEIKYDTLALGASKEVTVRTAEMPANPKNYRNAAFLAAPDQNELVLRVTRPNTFTRFTVAIGVRCAGAGPAAFQKIWDSADVGGPGANDWNMDVNKPYVGLFFQADGNVVIYQYQANETATTNIDTRATPLMGFQQLNSPGIFGATGLNFENGVVSTDNGGYTSSTPTGSSPAGTSCP